MKKSLTMMAVTLLLLAGCTWVHVSPAGEKVRVLSADEVADCEKVGVATVSLLAEVVGVKRSHSKIAKELETLGRNSGAEMGGDTIVSVSEIINGEQTFDVYRCFGR